MPSHTPQKYHLFVFKHSHPKCAPTTLCYFEHAIHPTYRDLNVISIWSQNEYTRISTWYVRSHQIPVDTCVNFSEPISTFCKFVFALLDASKLKFLLLGTASKWAWHHWSLFCFFLKLVLVLTICDGKFFIPRARHELRQRESGQHGLNQVRYITFPNVGHWSNTAKEVPKTGEAPAHQKSQSYSNSSFEQRWEDYTPCTARDSCIITSKALTRCPKAQPEVDRRH